MHDKSDYYEHIFVYLDDLLYAGKDAKTFGEKFNLLIINSKELAHLTITLVRTKEPEAMMTWGSVQYIQKIIDQYERMFGEPVRDSYKIHAPLEPGDHPELDNTELCNDNEKASYM